MRIAIDILRKQIVNALLAMQHRSLDAGIIADVLMYAEMRGNNQGVIKLISGGLQHNPTQTDITTLFESPISAKIDGGQRIGMVVVSHAVDQAIAKASNVGMSIVGCSQYASATGALGYWTKRITDHGFIGIAMSQCNEMVAPHGSYEPLFGTNPLSIGIPTKPRAQILDMATSACAYYGIKMAEQAGTSIAADIAYDEFGQPTTDPSAALRGAIRVFDRGHKGSHLALMVELLAGAFTGAAMQDKAQAKNWGSLVIAIRPDILGDAEDFLQRATEMCDRVKGAKLLPTESELFLPGERGDRLEAENIAAGTVEINEEVFQKLCEISQTISSS